MNFVLIDEFCNDCFQHVFMEYFNELEIEVDNWNGVFDSMNSQGGNFVFLLMNHNEALSFIQFRIEHTEHWFITEKFGFIREFWIKPTERKTGLGSVLLNQTEDYFRDQGITKILLTTDTAKEFYLKNGYKKARSYTALNNDPVYSKDLDS